MKRLIKIAVVVIFLILLIVGLISHWLGIEKFNQWYAILLKIVVTTVIAFVSAILTIWIEGGIFHLPKIAGKSDFFILISFIIGELDELFRNPNSIKPAGKSEFFVLLGQCIIVFVVILIVTIV